MKVTSAVANKRVRDLNKEIDFIYSNESSKMTYTEVEGVTPVVPDYDFLNTRLSLEALEKEVIAYKHAINKFNSETVVPGIDLTIDQVLIKMAQLNKQKERLEHMRKIQSKAVNTGFGRSTTVKVEYVVANFKHEDVESAYKAVCKQITDLQVNLDICNNTLTFEVDV